MLRAVSFIASGRDARQRDAGGRVALMRHDLGETDILIASGKFIVGWQL
jgi:hypothetical protein